MIRFLFLTLILFSSSAFAQTQDSHKAYKFIDFRYDDDTNIKLPLAEFQFELNQKPQSSGVIITYENFKNVGQPMSDIVLKVFKFLRIDETRIKVINGGYQGESSVEMWIIPKGAGLPKPNESYVKLFEYAKISNNLLKEKLNSFCEKIVKTKSEGRIINYGTTKEVAVRVRQINKNYSSLGDCHEARIIFVDGGKIRKSGTEFWIVPSNPKPPSSKLKDYPYH